MAASSKRKNTPARVSGNPAKRASGNPAQRPVIEAGPVTIGDWIGAARLRTLPLAVAPVVIGTGAARSTGPEFHWVIALACLAVAVLLQIGVNFANDYSDGIRGTDAVRVGPARLTASGRVTPRTVLVIALVFFALAAAVGIAIVVRTEQWWMLAIGAACVHAPTRPTSSSVSPRGCMDAGFCSRSATASRREEPDMWAASWRR